MRLLRLNYYSFCLEIAVPNRNSKKLEFTLIQTIISFKLLTSLSLSVLSKNSKCAFTAATHCIRLRLTISTRKSERLALWHEPRAECQGVNSKKEVFQPHLPVRLPCYDLAPITSFALGRSFRSRTSGTPGFHGLTGGVYKARERIHRAMADARLLANPASRSRVADSDPN